VSLGPLDGLRVVNLGVNLPAPVAAARLRELGADVAKLEPVGGDPLEANAPRWYEQLTAGQEVARVDLKAAAGRARLDAELARCDLLLTSSRPAGLARLGLGWPELGDRLPRLVQVAIVGHPRPLQDLPGHDLTYVARHGLLSPPALPRTLVADLAGAERAVSAALGLLLARERGGGARYAEVALSEAAAAFAGPWEHGLTADGGLVGAAWRRMGSTGPGGAGSPSRPSSRTSRSAFARSWASRDSHATTSPRPSARGPRPSGRPGRASATSPRRRGRERRAEVRRMSDLDRTADRLACARWSTATRRRSPRATPTASRRCSPPPRYSPCTRARATSRPSPTAATPSCAR